MGEVVTTVIRYDCDGCGKLFDVETYKISDLEGDVSPKWLPNGFHGDAYEISEAGSTGNHKWFACSVKCISKAVRSAIDRGLALPEGG